MSVEAVDQPDPPSPPTQNFPQVEVGNHFTNHWSSSQTNQASWFRFLLAGPPELPPGSGSSWNSPVPVRVEPDEPVCVLQVPD